ncbi:hypothetical protein NL676_023056 [Syzygium grande]|nr:hypothetical protein NL676_023056 [Syzygium grande]
MTTGLLEMDHALAKVILASKEDTWKDNELSRLVEDYFDHSSKLLDFYTSLDRCLRRARNCQSRIQLALTHFEEERGETVGGERYVMTLQELQKFKEAGDPFTDEFCKLSVRNQQEEMLQKLQAREKKLDKNLKNAQVGRRVTIAIFVTAFVSFLIFSVVAVKIAAPPITTALAAALAAPIGPIGQWCDSWWKNYRRVLNGRQVLIGLMKEGTKFSIRGLETIGSLVNNLQIKIESILQNANFALGEEDEEAVKLVMLEIKKGVEAVNGTIEDLNAQAGKSSGEIQVARTVIWQRLFGQSSR